MAIIQRRLAVMLFVAQVATTGCATSTPPPAGTVQWEEGLSQVRIDPQAGELPNTHPVRVTASEVATLLRGVRAGEHRNWFHRLVSGGALKIRAFRDDEIGVIAPPLAEALGKAGPADHVYFHLSEADPKGGELTTTGWVFVREPILYLLLSEVHDHHAPGPDISKYIRYMPDVPEAPVPFDATFEPEEYLVKERSKGSWLAPDQLEELQIRYRDALAVLPAYRIQDASPAEAPSPR